MERRWSEERSCFRSFVWFWSCLLIYIRKKKYKVLLFLSSNKSKKKKKNDIRKLRCFYPPTHSVHLGRGNLMRGHPFHDLLLLVSHKTAGSQSKERWWLRWETVRPYTPNNLVVLTDLTNKKTKFFFVLLLLLLSSACLWLYSLRIAPDVMVCGVKKQVLKELFFEGCAPPSNGSSLPQMLFFFSVLPSFYVF